MESPAMEATPKPAPTCAPPSKHETHAVRARSLVLPCLQLHGSVQRDLRLLNSFIASLCFRATGAMLAMRTVQAATRELVSKTPSAPPQQTSHHDPTIGCSWTKPFR